MTFLYLPGNTNVNNTDSDAIAKRSATPFKFAFPGAFAISTVVNLYEDSWTTQQILMHGSGSIVSAVLQSGSAVTGGTITLQPTINGTPTSSQLDLVLNTTDTLRVSETVDVGTITFSASERLGARLTSNGSFANGSAPLMVILEVVFTD